MTVKIPIKKKINTNVVNTEPFDIVPSSLNRDKKITLPTYEDVKKVKGIFRNLEFPGAPMTFPFREGWKGPIKKFTMFDGGEYIIPETLAKHLNERCAYKKMKWVADDGSQSVTALPMQTQSMPGYTQKIDKKTHRFMFQITG